MKQQRHPWFPRRLALTALAAVLAAGALGACVPLMVGGAAVGTLVAIDRRTSGAQLEDEGIEMRAANRLRGLMGERAHVNVTSYNRRVLLSGEVPDEAHKQTAEQAVTQVENVMGVVNELAIGPASTLTQRSADVLTTSRVRATLVDARDLFAGAFRVVTERGTVYLMGRVTQREADRATQLARSVGSVQKVVRMFEIISEDELARIQTYTRPQPPASQPPTR
ncbi:BON domain-containing protein [Ramlibacter tataouinensis]|uniref:Periplasmic protein-like protein n=1 Tax=Ramlibacter tataouinensis (strain ATCC BAA-407 / DSM 14655 / LMG 21543 / TTB310) TaxID=365046 RepID=F5XVH9_RAMTT|nr:BON domain-containing protein [Ramlibacter tataouinensis]AEG91555.1 periplasmic protein-like protein [Ramlibacter tataouinensis TTB310]